MASTEVLGTYINDHLSGANAGVEIVQRLHQRAGDGPDAAVLARLVEDIEQDRDELRALVEQLGESGHPVKKAAGWVAGRAHRVAVGELLTGDEHLSMLLETETLALGHRRQAGVVGGAARGGIRLPPARRGPAHPTRHPGQ